MGVFVVLMDRSHTLLRKSVASKVIQVFQSASVWQQSVVTMFQQDVKMSQDVNRLRTVLLQDQAGHNVLCFICHISLCDNGTGSVLFVLFYLSHQGKCGWQWYKSMGGRCVD